jgi:LacI family transcriptional regulator
MQRLRGYRRTLERNGMKILPEYVIAEPKGDVDTRQRGAEAMRKLLQCDTRPDAVFCFNDPLAIGAMNCILDEGLRIPEDIALIGCGNLNYDDTLRVPLSSVDQRSRQIGEETARVALGILTAKRPPAVENIILKPQLVVRASTQRGGK